MNESIMEARAVRCPACDGPVFFEPGSGKLRCKRCDALFSPEELDGRSILSETEQAPSDWGGDAKELSAYACSYCGAKLLTDRSTAALHCPYCGYNTVVPAQFSGSIRPDWIIPFSQTREQALGAYRAYYHGNVFRRLLLPRAFRREQWIEELQGVYVPFRLFDGAAEFDAVYSTYDVVSRGWLYETRKYYREERQGTIAFEKVPADASVRMDDALMDSIEPYDVAALTPFSLSYLPGMLAERFDVGEKEDLERARERVKKTALARLEKTIHHQNVNEKKKKEKVELRLEKTHYALLPVWLLTTRWKDEKYTFAMNGQTGALTGDLPMSVWKTLALMLLAFALPVALLCWINPSLWDVGSLIGVFTALIAWLGLFAFMKPVVTAYDAEGYMKEELKLSLETDRFTTQKRVQKS